MERTAPISRAMNPLAGHVETFAAQGTFVLTELAYAQQAKHPMGRASAQKKIYCAMEHVLTKALMIITAENVEMLVPAGRSALRELVITIPM